MISSAKCLTVLIAALLFLTDSKAQQTVQNAGITDTVHAGMPWQPNPKKAGLYAALLPGLGQIYNRQYWKLPIVYGGLSVAGYFIVRNTKDYNSLRSAYISRIGQGSGPYTDEYADIYKDTDQLKQLQDDANRLLNLTIVFSGVAYVAQILDAVTSAHLRNFDISRDISLHVRPVMLPQGPAAGIVMNF